jgi:hypothetical protein
MTDWSATLARAFEATVQKCGDSGASGDKRTKYLKHGGVLPRAPGTTSIVPVVTVVTPARGVTTVTTAAPSCGAKGEGEILPIIKEDRQSVTTVTTVTTDIRLPDACECLRSMTRPDSFSSEAWHQLLLDTDCFFQRWVGRRELIAWSYKDLLGVHPRAPASRYDAMGLLLLIRSGEVVKLRDQCATIRTQGGSPLTYRKHGTDDAVPLWEVDAYLERLHLRHL